MFSRVVSGHSSPDPHSAEVTDDVVSLGFQPESAGMNYTISLCRYVSRTCRPASRGVFYFND
jgi:hypothetical protein